MSQQRVSLYDRLPQIYRIKDAEQVPPDQLKNYLALVEEVFGDIHENIESLYHDLFIETCDDWVVPYIGDLLGTSTLKGDPWTLRADVADTIPLRRRKGTLRAIERLTYDLTRWSVHCVELRENLLWNQHLNHQRPDEGGPPPYSLPTVTRKTPIRGGTVSLREPAMLSLLNTPFDPFAHTPDLKPPSLGNIRYNLPNLAIFLWRLSAYQVPVSKPVFRGIEKIDLVKFPQGAPLVVRFDVHPLGQPVRLFNLNHFDPNQVPPLVSLVDEKAAPIPTVRLTDNSSTGVPAKYVSVELYKPDDLATNPLDIGKTGLQLHLPASNFPEILWHFRGENLCSWETGLLEPLKTHEITTELGEIRQVYEIAIDPVIGRIAIAVKTDEEAQTLRDYLLLTYTYGAVGAVGAHPIPRQNEPLVKESGVLKWAGEPVTMQEVRFHENSQGLHDALMGLENATTATVIEIMDSMTYELDLTGIVDSEGNLRLNRSLMIRAASGQRPIIILSQPLKFRPANVFSDDDDKKKKKKKQEEFDEVMNHLNVRLEGLYLTRSHTYESDRAMITRVALNRLELINCTLDPGGFVQLDGTVAKIENPAIKLENFYGFSPGTDEEKAFKQTPDVIIQRSITGPLLIDENYSLTLSDSIIDAGKGVDADSSNFLAISSANDPDKGWGAPTTISNITVFGRTRVLTIAGRGGIWVHQLEVLNNQQGCLKFCYFSGENNRLPQNYACVTGKDAKLNFVSEHFAQPAYGQLHFNSDFSIREQGPNDDAMGAFGFLLEAHKWRNLQIRYREFMPVGVRPLLIPVN